MHWNCLQLHWKWRKGEEIAKDGGASFQFARDVDGDQSCVVQWHKVKGSHNCKSMNFNFLKHFVSSVSVDPFYSLTFTMLKYGERWNERQVYFCQVLPETLGPLSQFATEVNVVQHYSVRTEHYLPSFLLLCGDRANHKSLPA